MKKNLLQEWDVTAFVFSKIVTNLFVPAFLCMLLFVISCGKDTADKNPSLYSLNEAEKNFLKKAGFDPDKIVVYEDYLLVDGDIIIDRNEIKNKLDACISGNSGRIDQFAINAVVGINNVNQIRYFIHPSVNAIPIDGNDWATAMRNAAQDWTNIANCRASFTEVFNQAQANLIVVSDNPVNNTISPACLRNLNNNFWAYAAFPVSSNVGGWISINDNNPGASNADGKRSIMRHEIGHNLGYRHINWQTNNEPVNAPGECPNAVFGANQLPGTPTNENNSIMFSAFNGVTLVNFTANDIQAAHLLYPDAFCCAPQNPLITSISPAGPNMYLVNYHINASSDYCFYNVNLVGGPSASAKIAANTGVGSFLVYDPNPFPTFYSINVRGANYQGDLQSAMAVSPGFLRP